MARFDEVDTTGIYETAAKWKNESLMNGDSLLWPGEPVWTPAALTAFDSCFSNNLDETKDVFLVKFKRQLADQEPVIVKLACELLLIHFLFTMKIKGKKKRAILAEVAGWKGLTIDEQQPSIKCLERGIGGPGQAYNTRRPFELAYVAGVALNLVGRELSERAAILADHRRVRELLEQLEGNATFASKDVLLHLMFPDQYERIASSNHKKQLAEVFSEFVEGANAKEDLDDRLLLIRQSLEGALPGINLDFYKAPLSACWYTAREAEELSPLQALEIKRQIVLYGPPGTGKTYDAKMLAEMLIRQGALRAWKPKRYFADKAAVDRLAKERVRRIQLHPGYGYEDLVRGINLVDGGKTAYRNGVLLSIIEDLKKQPDEERSLPFVVILDEMNRADLSKVLGECFSLLEDREGAIQLAGQDECPCLVRMPRNLYFIGTMNLIDQSLEQVDFALRRRFLWFFYGFEPDDFIAVAKLRWDEKYATKQLPKAWDQFEDEFELLAERAKALNKLIEDHRSLGKHYQIGHTYFCDIVSFAQKDLVTKSKKNLLFNKKGEALAPVVALWRYSLRPLLEQYLSGVDETERDAFLRQANETLTKEKA